MGGAGRATRLPGPTIKQHVRLVNIGEKVRNAAAYRGRRRESILITAMA
jgi:hypothetical protein